LVKTLWHPTVALESTGIYWISLYEILEQYGLEIPVVNAQQMKHVPDKPKPMYWIVSGFRCCTASACQTVLLIKWLRKKLAYSISNSFLIQ
jgi:hypothetical protein